MENLEDRFLTQLRRRDMLVDMYTQRMFVEYDIKEITNYDHGFRSDLR